MSGLERIRKVVCVSTSKPTDNVATSGGGGSLAVLCPFTGSVYSSMRVSADVTGNLPIGVSSVSLFPSSFSPSESLALAFGSSVKKDDTYAVLATLRQTSLSPTVHWKCRLPEAQMSAGLLVSTCGNYIVGGGASGNVYVWKSLGGLLLSTFKAHYRSVSCMAWSSCGRILVTGGADGIIHGFSLLSMVATGSNESSMQPLRSFSHHQLPIAALKSLPSGRMVSGSQDGRVTVIELFSEQILASIQLPHPVTALDVTAHRLFVGTLSGTIHCIDLDQYALHQTHLQGAILVGKMEKNKQEPSTSVFDFTQSPAEDTSTSYKVELRGHDRAVTSLAVIFDYEEEWLISGDQAGAIRVWDMASRACVRTIHLWSQNKQSSSATSKGVGSATEHPVASIVVLDDYAATDKTSDSILSQIHQQIPVGRNQSSKNPNSVINQIKALQRFCDDDSRLLTNLTITLKRPEHTFWHNVKEIDAIDLCAAVRKRLKRGETVTEISCFEKDKEIERLRQELALATQALEERTSKTCS